MYIVLGLIATIILLIIYYQNFNPQSWGKNLKYDSKYYNNGKFENLVNTSLSTGDKNMMLVMYEFIFKKNPEAFPLNTIQTQEINRKLLKNLKADQIAITWLGHSTSLIVTESVTIITDPVLHSKNISPMYMGPKKFPYSNNYEFKNLPKVDIVLISHDHYDHLDMDSIIKLKDSIFYVPLGIKAHLLRWGIEEKNVYEMDWYEEFNYSENLKLVLTPARHFSGRGIFNRDSTLWGSWVIDLSNRRVYFGGDSGYFGEFKRIGEHYGPFDLVLLDTGQYNPSWQSVHMLPNEAVQASIDLKANALLTIHNSKYILSNHSWFEPLEKVEKEAKKKGVKLVTPRIGQTFLVDENMPQERWWEDR